MVNFFVNLLVMFGQGIPFWDINAKEIFGVDDLVCPDTSVKFWAQRPWEVTTCGNWHSKYDLLMQRRVLILFLYKKEECGDTDTHRHSIMKTSVE